MSPVWRGFELSLRHDAIISGNQTQERRRCQIRIVTKSQRAQADRNRRGKSRTLQETDCRQERLVVQKITRERLIALGPKIKRTSDVGESCQTYRVANDWYAILEVSEYLRIAANRSKRSRQGRDVAARRACKHAKARQHPGSQESSIGSPPGFSATTTFCEVMNVSTGAIGTDRTHVVTANRKLVAKEEPLEDRNAIHKRE